MNKRVHRDKFKDKFFAFYNQKVSPRPRLSAYFWLWLIIFILLSLLPGDASGAGVGVVRENPPGKIKRIVLITLSTVRADHLGFMGYPRKTSPFLDKMASEGVLFKNAFTFMPVSAPALASVHTSMYPTTHKVLGNESVLDERFTTMAGYLKREGYETGAFVSGYFLGIFKRGFEHFDVPDAEKYPLKNNPAFRYKSFYNVKSFKRKAADTVAAAIGWLSGKSADADVFLWVQLFDTHSPFPKEGNEYKESPGDTLTVKTGLAGFLTEQQGIGPGSFKADRNKNMLTVINRHDGEIQYMDSQIKRLYEFMSSKGLNQNSLWIITSDHGEGLGSHSFYGHAERVYNEQLRCPIIFHMPDRKTGMVVDALAEGVDILPTLSGLVGFTLDVAVPPDGRDLKPFVQGVTRTEKKYVFSMRGDVLVDMQFCKNMQKRIADVLPVDIDVMSCSKEISQYSLQDENYKLIRNAKDGDEFYNLRDDPNEKKNLIAIESGKKDEMRRILNEMLKKMQ